MLYGFDANVLGRPLNYVTATKPLPTAVQNNIKYNATNLPAATTDFGMCGQENH